jgi:hypothetical protein
MRLEHIVKQTKLSLVINRFGWNFKLNWNKAATLVFQFRETSVKVKILNSTTLSPTKNWQRLEHSESYPCVEYRLASNDELIEWLVEMPLPHQITQAQLTMTRWDFDYLGRILRQIYTA